MERRGFIKNCALLCAGGIGIAALMESCGSIHYATSTIETNKIKINRSEFIDLPTGQAGKKNTERKFVVVRSEKLDFPICIYKIGETFNAVSMKCSHQGCELNPNETSLVCPCHGSEFSKEGKVLNPPADKDLKQFKVITNNETIYIEL